MNVKIEKETYIDVYKISISDSNGNCMNIFGRKNAPYVFPAPSQLLFSMYQKGYGEFCKYLCKVPFILFFESLKLKLLDKNVVKMIFDFI